jgi:hypothetical protein
MQHIRYKGVLDFTGCWKVIMDWFESKGFEVQEDKAKRNMRVFGEELETVMTGWRNVTDYYRFRIQVYQKYWDAQPVDVVKNGEKKRLLKARIFFRIGGELVLDYSDRYETSRMTKALGNFMNKYVLKWQYDVIYGDQLMYKVYELANVIKEYINSQTRGNEFADMW